jgi:hypothetical protein
MIERALFLFVLVVAVAPAAAETIETAASGLGTALDALEARADRADSLSYRLVCFEQVLRRVRREGHGKDPIFVAGNATEMRRGVVVERGSGEETSKRVRVNRKQEVRRGKGGAPIEAGVPERFRPIASRFPSAASREFGADAQKHLRFEVLAAGGDPGRYRIACPQPEQLAVEFVDAEPPRKTDGENGPSCEARPSGQMCLEPESGEITRIVFYALEVAGETCGWDVENPPVRIWQDVVEKNSRLRFATRIETDHTLDARDTAIFVQRFKNCEFLDVSAAGH